MSPHWEIQGCQRDQELLTNRSPNTPTMPKTFKWKQTLVKKRLWIDKFWISLKIGQNSRETLPIFLAIMKRLKETMWKIRLTNWFPIKCNGTNTIVLDIKMLLKKHQMKHRGKHQRVIIYWWELVNPNQEYSKKSRKQRMMKMILTNLTKQKSQKLNKFKNNSKWIQVLSKLWF